MNSTLEACLRSWPFAPWLATSLIVAAALYLRGWLVLRRSDPLHWHGGRLAAYFGGLVVIFMALASPIELFAHLLLQVHMLQHLLLMMVAAPLLWLGTPLLPILRGLPRPVLKYWVAPLLASRPLRRFFRRLTHPLFALPVFVVATWLWHLPPLYDLALRSDYWHYAQHVSFLAAAMLFWYPVVRPYPARPHWSRWLLLPYLLLADLSNTILSAVLTFSDRVLYTYYSEMPRLAGISVLDDQSAAGALMWVPGSLAFLIPLFAIGVRLLFGPQPEVRSRKLATLQRRNVSSESSSPTPGFDLLRVALIGRFLRWRHARLCLQIPLLILAAFVIYDGLYGPQLGATNLAGVLPWIHWRGLLIVGLLAVGNVFCMGCPFLLPRTVARRWLPARWNWPPWLRNKWPAVLLTVAFLWAYEALALWDRPVWTACLALSYFAAALVIDGLFSGASFCKYVCPIGQFNFVQSLASPLEVKARDPAVCVTCRTKDCIRGRNGISGCELQLYVPRKASNMDCTMCLDCAHACPHENIGMIAGFPTAQLWNDRQRSGVGRFSRRRDIAALIVLLVFGAFANAAGMVGPVVDELKRFAGFVGVHSHLAATTAFYLVALIVLPIVSVGGAAALSRRSGQSEASTLDVATRYVYALVPLGFGMWLAHYSFHFLTSYETAVPVTQRFAADIGLTWLGPPVWECACCRPVTASLLRLELLFLDVGMLLSLYTGYRLAPSLKALAPWALLIVVLFASGVWIVFQPMQMRGTI